MLLLQFYKSFRFSEIFNEINENIYVSVIKNNAFYVNKSIENTP